MKVKYLFLMIFLIFGLNSYSQLFAFENDCYTSIEIAKIKTLDTFNTEYQITIKIKNINTNPLYLPDTTFWFIHQHYSASISLLFIDLGFNSIASFQNGYYTDKVSLKELTYDKLLTQVKKIKLKGGKWQIRVGNDYIIHPKLNIKKPIDFNKYFLHSIKGQMLLNLEL